LREKESRIDAHVSRQWENFCRRVHPGASRYWEGDVEIDLVAPLGNKGRLLIAECKWSQLRNEEENKLLSELQKKFYKTRLSQRVAKVDFYIFSKRDLPLLTEKELKR
jgi:AAA+ ATPase superfamily predicted ATPase